MEKFRIAGLVCSRNRYNFQGDRVGNGISYQEPKRDGKSSRGGEASCRGRRSLGGAVAEDEQTAGSPQRSHAITSTGAAAVADLVGGQGGPPTTLWATRQPYIIQIKN